jgi:ribonucleoside-diphosphate reductase alpha chain
VILKIAKVIKREGSVVEFRQEKVTNAIQKALNETKESKRGLAEKLSNKVVSILEKNFSGKIPNVEEIQDVVEKVLIESGHAKTAKAYILYRQRRAELRKEKELLGVKDVLKLSINAIIVLKKRYLLRNEKMEIVETPAQMFRRVAKAIAKVDLVYDNEADVEKGEEEFYKMMANLEFLPNSPTLMNAGLEIGQLSACFVLPVEDSLKGIFESVKNAALIQQSGGGTGFSFSRLRPRGDVVKSTYGVASGPVSFMRIFDSVTNEIKQGSRRRGANMGILNSNHPDIIEFITAKSKEGVLNNFNLSVAVTDEFMRAVEKNGDYSLLNPRSGIVANRINAKSIFDLIVTMAWNTGDPGLVFIDEINRHNPTPKLGEFEATNPCGELPLLAYEACNLGSINLSKFVDEKGVVDWGGLKEVVWKGVHFLDNVIDANRYPVPETERIVKGNRKIGLGVMGFADALIKMKISYDSERALAVGEKFIRFVSEEGRKASVELAKRRGVFLNFDGSVWERRGIKIRNATITTVAPTGTISIIANCSGGIEPLFAVSFVREVMEGAKLLEVDPQFEKIARERKFYSEELMHEIAKAGSVQNIEGVPKDVKKVFMTALDIEPEWHVKMQAAFQKYVDNAVAKTVNLPEKASLEDVRRIYMLAYKLKCKGITVYRYGSKEEQVLKVGAPLQGRKGEENVVANSEYSGGCPTGECMF